MNTEPPYAGLKWAHYLRVMLLVPLDQGTQGNKGRKAISLVNAPLSSPPAEYVPISLFDAKSLDKPPYLLSPPLISVERPRNRWGHWEHVPPRFCNKQRSVLFTSRKCPLSRNEKSALKVSCPPSLRCFLPCERGNQRLSAYLTTKVFLLILIWL